WPNATLLRHGCLGSAPTKPTLAFTLRTLAQFHELHRVCPCLSAEAQIRALCNLNRIPYQKNITDQFRITYDAYLEILGRVQRRVDIALKRDTPNWRALNVCPACDYRLQDEPSLKYSKLICIDGNNSLRRVNLKFTREVETYIDTRKPRTDYWLFAEAVDMFKDEVKAKKAAELVETIDPGDVADGASFVTVCIQRWRNAGPEERKRMWQIFVETGIFVAVCRHGFMLYICDMIQSGELAKYGLALTDKLINVYGSNLCIGYDIGCAFSST
ncbi:hypothetical protein M422DRAFT_145220, partial [Sphaerobolus stellatus SS14]